MMSQSIDSEFMLSMGHEKLAKSLSRKILHYISSTVLLFSTSQA